MLYAFTSRLNVCWRWAEAPYFGRFGRSLMRLLLGILLILSSIPSWASWSNTNLGNGWTGVVSTLATPGADGGSTTGVDTTGANLLVFSISDRIDTTASCTPSDTIGGSPSGNMWTALVTNPNDRGVAHVRFWYVNSQTPNVGAMHVVTCSGMAIQPTLIFMAASIAGGWSLDQQNGAGAGGTVSSIQPGSITPSANGGLLLTNVSDFGGVVGLSAPTGFSAVEGVDASAGTNAGGFVASMTQATATAENPTWPFSFNPSFSAAAIVSFKPGSSGGGGCGGLALLGVGCD